MTQNFSDAGAIIYVRVDVDTKRRLKTLAEKDFNGSMAAAIRYLLAERASGKQGRDLDDD